MDMNFEWAKLALDTAVGLGGGIFAFGVAFFSWRKKTDDAEDKKREELKAELIKEMDQRIVDVNALKLLLEKEKDARLASEKKNADRFNRGQIRMVRIEERLAHTPTAEQFSDLSSQIAALEQATNGTNNIVGLIHAHLMSGNGEAK